MRGLFIRRCSVRWPKTRARTLSLFISINYISTDPRVRSASTLDVVVVVSYGVSPLAALYLLYNQHHCVYRATGAMRAIKCSCLSLEQTRCHKAAYFICLCCHRQSGREGNFRTDEGTALGTNSARQVVVVEELREEPPGGIGAS